MKSAARGSATNPTNCSAKWFNAGHYAPVAKRLAELAAERAPQRWQGQFGAQLERVFFHSWLRSKLGARIYHNNRSLKGAPVLLINHSDLPFEPQLWLTALLVSSSHCPVEVFDAPVPGGELGLAVEHLQPRARRPGVYATAPTGCRCAGARPVTRRRYAGRRGSAIP